MFLIGEFFGSRGCLLFTGLLCGMTLVPELGLTWSAVVAIGVFGGTSRVVQALEG